MWNITAHRYKQLIYLYYYLAPVWTLVILDSDVEFEL